ncbi:DUF1566 domain-containing protein [Myxococcota bacterium]
MPESVYTRTDAATYSEDLILAGYDDWHLPTAIELVSIVDYGVQSPTINPTVFPDTPPAKFWSSSLCAWETDPPGWVVHFVYGHVDLYGMTTTCHVRCVRGGPLTSDALAAHLPEGLPWTLTRYATT